MAAYCKMKTKDTLIIRWPFGLMFQGKKVVRAKLDAPKSNPSQKEFYLSDIQMTSVTVRHQHIQRLPPGRYVRAHLKELQIEGQKGGFWSRGLAETLERAGVPKDDFIEWGSMDFYWRLKKGESFTSGAPRIARELFKLLEVRLVGLPPNTFLQDSDVPNLLVVYKKPRVSIKGNFPSLGDYLRKAPHLSWLDIYVI